MPVQARLLDRIVVGNRFHALLDRAGLGCFVGWCGQGDAAGGVDGAAAVTELVASRAMLGTYEKVAGFLSGSSGANAMEAGRPVMVSG